MNVDTHRLEVTVVVPVHNNGVTLVELTRRIFAALEGSWPTAIVFVDDASRDGSWGIIETLAADDARVRGIRLADHAGQVAAAMTGMALAESPVVATIDADLEASPEDLPALVAAVAAGHDFVNGRRIARRAPMLRRRATSWAFNLLVRLLTRLPIHDVGSGSTAMTKAVALRMIEEVSIRPHQMVKPIFFRVAERPTEVRSTHPGSFSSSGYRWLDLVGFVIEFLREYGPRRVRPFRQPLSPPPIAEWTDPGPPPPPW